jgi:hypothetical protein
MKNSSNLFSNAHNKNQINSSLSIHSLMPSEHVRPVGRIHWISSWFATQISKRFNRSCTVLYSWGSDPIVKGGSSCGVTKTIEKNYILQEIQLFFTFYFCARIARPVLTFDNKIKYLLIWFINMNTIYHSIFILFLLTYQQFSEQTHWCGFKFLQV